MDRIGLNHVTPASPAGPAPAPPSAGRTGGPSFADTLQREIQRPGELRFSGHAQERLRQRSIQLSPVDVQRLQDAVGKAEAKGSRESLVLMDDVAFVVSVRNRTVITAIDQNSERGKVFTNIDSVVITDGAGRPALG